MQLVYFSQIELVINQDVWVVILVVKMSIIYYDVAAITHTHTHTKIS